MLELKEKVDVQTEDINENATKSAEFKRRMLQWSNPVEFVNNMYGSHPDDGGTDYFKQIFSK